MAFLPFFVFFGQKKNSPQRHKGHKGKKKTKAAIFDTWLFCLSLCSLGKRRIHRKDTKGTKERKRPRRQFLIHGFSAFLCVLWAKGEFTTKTQRAQRKEK